MPRLQESVANAHWDGEEKGKNKEEKRKEKKKKQGRKEKKEKEVHWISNASNKNV